MRHKAIAHARVAAYGLRPCILFHPDCDRRPRPRTWSA